MKERILLVEDEPMLIDMMQAMLGFFGYECSIAQNGEEAVSKALSEIPDLIIMDTCMPKMDGVRAAGIIRKNPQTKAVPILAATGLVPLGKRQNFLRNAYDGVLVKPFTPRELKAAIETLLRRQPKLAVGR